MDLAADVAALIARVPREGPIDAIAALEPRLGETQDPVLRFHIAKLLGFYWLRRGDHTRALAWNSQALQHDPADRDCAYNALYAALHLGSFDEAAARCRAAIARFGEQPDFYDVLSASLGAAGRLAEAAVAGTRGLGLKSLQATSPAHDLSAVKVPPFDATRPERNIIAFSLFGDRPKYTDGAVLNARAAPFVYPGWTARFYVDDSVPAPIRTALTRAGAQVMHVGGLPSAPYGPLWRFLVADDPSVDRYVLRDVDSLINTRERVAVDAWIASGRHFHLMRDHFDHTELVLAGMWGGVRGALPPVLSALRAWEAGQKALGYTADQLFLRTALWPSIRQSVLAHDSLFAFGEVAAFPSVGGMPAGCWVGCPWHLHARKQDVLF